MEDSSSDEDSTPRYGNGSKIDKNLVSTWTSANVYQDLTVPLEVSRTRRILQITVAVVYCVLATGLVFGYAALKPVLVDQGVYRDRCTHNELQNHVQICQQQDLRLNLMFTVASASTNVATLPVGAILDRWGPRPVTIIGAILLAIGCLLFGLATPLHLDVYIPGFLFLSLGGAFLVTPTFQLSNTFPTHSGLILTLLIGGFDASTAVFLVYRLAYERWHGFTIEKFFLAYLSVPIAIIVAQIFLMPSKSYRTLTEVVQEVQDRKSEDAEAYQRNGNHDGVVAETAGLLGATKYAQQLKKEEKKREISGVWGALHGYSARQQILSPWFLLIALLTIVSMTRINYFVATIRTQYTSLLGDAEAAARINSFFDVAFPVGGIVSIPFVGFVLDRTSTTFVLSLLVGLATLIGVLGVLPYLWAAYVNVCLFVFYRTFFFTAGSDFAAKVFGFATFGKVYGAWMALSGLLGFFQQLFDNLTHQVFESNPVPVNVVLLVAGLITGIAIVAYVWRQSRRMRRNKLELEAEGVLDS